LIDSTCRSDFVNSLIHTATKFEVPSFNYSKDRKGVPKYTKVGGYGSLNVTENS